MSKEKRKINRIIERYKEELLKFGIKPEKIVLFGSYATGNPRPDSDIDLIVISNNFKKINLRERLEILGLAAGKVFEPIEALGYTPKEVKKELKETFVGEIIRK